MNQTELRIALQKAVPDYEERFRLEFVVDATTFLMIVGVGREELSVVNGDGWVKRTTFVLDIPHQILLRSTRKVLRNYVLNHLRVLLTNDLVRSVNYEYPTMHHQSGKWGPKLCDLDWEPHISVQNVKLNDPRQDLVVNDVLRVRFFGEDVEF